MEDLKTGDIIFCNYTKRGGCMSIFTRLIKYFTNSNYSHIAVVLKDPSFIQPPLKGTYVWESSWEGKPDPQDGKVKLGVQITPLEELMDEYREKGHMYVRRVQCPPTLFSNKNMKKIHDVVYDKPYDIVPSDWLEALLKNDPSPQKISRFWCSALVGYIYTKCGLLDKKTDWTILSPADFSIEHENVRFINKTSLADKIEKII
jgi:hypothetical protein